MKIQPSPFSKGEATPRQRRHDTLVISSSIAFSKIFLGRGLQILSLYEVHQQRGLANNRLKKRGGNPPVLWFLFQFHQCLWSRRSNYSQYVNSCLSCPSDQFPTLALHHHPSQSLTVLLEQHMLSTCGHIEIWNDIMNVLSWASKSWVFSSQRKTSFLPC